MKNVLSIENVYRASRFLDTSSFEEFGLPRLRGRLVEISSPSSHASITLATSLMARAHQEGEPTAWIGPKNSIFYPPDLLKWPLDMNGLALILLDEPRDAGRAADRLLRSGGFGLVVIDLFSHSSLPSPLMGRLLKLAETHKSVLLFLTPGSERDPSLSSLISLRIIATWKEARVDQLRGSFQIIKDKKRGPGQSFEEVYYGPMGLR